LNIVLVGDLFIPGRECIVELARVGKRYNMDYHILDWEMGSLEELNRRNLNVEKNGPSAEPPPEELWSLIGNADILIVHFCPVSKELMDAALRLKIIGTMRTGLSNIDTISVKERGINMVNLPGRLADSVAEYTVGMIIAETRNIARSHEALRSGRWVKNYYSTPFCFELAGKTIGIIGFGEIGKRVAAKLASFDVKILVYDPLFTEEDAHRGDIVKAELHELLELSDVITIHAKLDSSTRGLIGEQEISKMKKTAYIINTARAAIIDREALFNALSAKKIAGAAFDVFWNEPADPNDPLLHLENITVTTHLAGSTQDALLKSLSKLNERLDPYYRELSRENTR
jgi:D-3-phosphoglycerate dehydrogenase